MGGDFPPCILLLNGFPAETRNSTRRQVLPLHEPNFLPRSYLAFVIGHADSVLAMVRLG